MQVPKQLCSSAALPAPWMRTKSEEPRLMGQIPRSWNRAVSMPPDEQPSLRSSPTRSPMVQKTPIPKKHLNRATSEMLPVGFGSALDIQLDGIVSSPTTGVKEGQNSMVHTGGAYPQIIQNNRARMDRNHAQHTQNLIPNASTSTDEIYSTINSNGSDFDDYRCLSPTVLLGGSSSTFSHGFSSGERDSAPLSNNAESMANTVRNTDGVHGKARRSPNCSQSPKRRVENSQISPLVPLIARGLLRKNQRPTNCRVLKPASSIISEVPKPLNKDEIPYKPPAQVLKVIEPALTQSNCVQAQQFCPDQWDPMPFKNGLLDEPLLMLPHSYYYQHYEEIPIIHVPSANSDMGSVAPSELMKDPKITEQYVGPTSFAVPKNKCTL